MSLRALSSLVFVVASVALADVPPADISGCSNKKAGDACQTDDKKSGGCKSTTCSRVDATQTPPTTVEYACVKCDAGTKPTGGCQSTPWLSLAALFPVLLRRRPFARP